MAEPPCVSKALRFARTDFNVRFGSDDSGTPYLLCRCRAHKLSKCEKHSTPGVRFVPLSSPVQKMRYGIAWRKGSVEEVVARFVQYVMQQFGSK
jgi:hypothetical protein